MLGKVIKGLLWIFGGSKHFSLETVSPGHLSGTFPSGHPEGHAALTGHHIGND